MDAAAWLLWIAAIYIGVGICFAFAFLAVGVQRIDEAAIGAPFFFRVLIFPGVAALWPVVLVKWLRADPARAAEGHQ